MKHWETLASFNNGTYVAHLQKLEILGYTTEYRVVTGFADTPTLRRLYQGNETQARSAFMRILKTDKRVML